METIYLKLNDQIDVAVRIQCDPYATHEAKEQAAMDILRRTMNTGISYDESRIADHYEGAMYEC